MGETDWLHVRVAVGLVENERDRLTLPDGGSAGLPVQILAMQKLRANCAIQKKDDNGCANAQQDGFCKVRRQTLFGLNALLERRLSNLVSKS